MKTEIVIGFKNLKMISDTIEKLSRNHLRQYPKSDIGVYNKKVQKQIKDLKRFLQAIDFEIEKDEKKFRQPK